MPIGLPTAEARCPQSRRLGGGDALFADNRVKDRALG
jgi:hypothetical protein